ncbi:MAG TPA: c-type cytochrome [Burkholderiaceae bacterium]|nr:c-type cytochrome [Burkholderiaceae bacterium]
MSDAHHQAPVDIHATSHEGPIKTPKQLVMAVILAFVVPVIAIILLASYVVSNLKPAAGSDALSPEAVARRIHPVGTVEVKDVNDVATTKTGEQVFGAQCTACHSTGAAGAPKIGDQAAWGPRIKQGFETLMNSALKGKGAMPAQGGGDFSDLEIARAVAFMANKAGAGFEEPKAPAPAPVVAQAAATAASATGAEAAPQVAAALKSTETKPDTTGTPAAAATPSGATPALYTQTCSACHASGVAGAPKVGDKAAWAPRIGQGIDGLTANAIKGKGAMPPKGGSSASDAEIKAVVTYMVNAAK